MIMKKSIIFFTGAGISQESGIPTFRGDNNSLWNKYDIDIVASIKGLNTAFDKVLEFHNEGRKMMEMVQPNYCHNKIAELENNFDITIITTNIDNLHEKAGSSKIKYLHGNIFEACDIDKNKPYQYNKDIKEGDIHPETKKQLRHNTVLFGEQLPEDTLNIYKNTVKNADYLIIIGSSLSVYPSSNIVNYNNNIIYINPILPEDKNYKKWNIIQDTACNGIDKAIELIK